MTSWPKRPQDPPNGTCDGGRFVECCTTLDGMSECHLTTIGSYMPAAHAYLAWILPDDESEPGTLDRVGELIDTIPSPAGVVDAWKEGVKDLAEVVKPNIGDPTINVNLPKLPALVPLALLGLVAGAGIAVWGGRRK